jgi:GNAT superfamily N-acetyltransferase
VTFSLRRVHSSEDPFEDYPQLKNIWSPEKTDIAAAASKEDAGTGEIFFIEYQDTVVGITGFFVDEEDDDPSHLYLRWTGVVSAFRRRGLASLAIELLKPKAVSQYIERNILIEMVPFTEHGLINIAPFFESLGFTPLGQPYKEDWADHKWQNYALDLNKE